MALEGLLQGLEKLFAENVVVGGFIISFLGNAVPYMTVPYLAAIAAYAAAIQSPWERLILVLASGIGAGLGKVIVYLIGRGARLLISTERRREMQLAARLMRRSVFLAVFLFAALPLPDDILYLPLGVMGYSLSLFTIAVVAGKIVITGAAVMLGASFAAVAPQVEPLYLALAAAITGIGLSVIVARMSWIRVIDAYERRGFLVALQVLGEEVINALKPGSRQGMRSANAGDLDGERALDHRPT